MGLKVTWRAGNAYATGTVQGRRIRQSLGTRDKAQAEQARAELEARIWRQGVYGDPEVRTFEEAALSYMEAGGESRFLAPLIAHFRGVKVASIRPGHVRDAARRLYPKASPATQKRQAVTPAMAVINHAHDKGWSGLIRVKMKAGKPAPRVAVKRDYIDALRAACLAHKPPARHLAALMLFLHQTGGRLGEAIALTPADVDLDQALAFAENTKNGHPRRFELTSEIVSDLRRLRPRAGRVFGYATRNGVYRALRAVCAEAELPYLATHQPGRHSFATALDALGFSTAAIAKAGNWRSVQLVAQTYTHPENAGRAAADALDIGAKLAQSGSE